MSHHEHLSWPDVDIVAHPPQTAVWLAMKKNTSVPFEVPGDNYPPDTRQLPRFGWLIDILPESLEREHPSAPPSPQQPRRRRYHGPPPPDEGPVVYFGRLLKSGRRVAIVYHGDYLLDFHIEP